MDFGNFVYSKRAKARAACDFITDHDITGEWYLHRNTRSDAGVEDKWVVEVCFEKPPTKHQIEKIAKGGKFLGFEEKSIDGKTDKGDG